MPSILNLKFKGNKSFVAFSNLNDTEALTKTWKVCTKVASYLEQGQRLENLSWRLWHLQNLMVDTDNAKSKREFRKLSKCMGDKLDKEKGRSIEELEAPDFKHNHSTDMIRQRAVEKERSREASQNALPGTIKRLQFTFPLDQPSQPVLSAAPVKKPNTKPSAEFGAKRTRAATAAAAVASACLTTTATSTAAEDSSSEDSMMQQPFLHFPGLFNNDFGPSALLYAAPTVTNRMNYGEGFNPSSDNSSPFSISRPTIELALDDFFNDDIPRWHDASLLQQQQQQDVVMNDQNNSCIPTLAILGPLNLPSEEDTNASTPQANNNDSSSSLYHAVPPLSQTVKEVLPETVAPIRLGSSSSSSSPSSTSIYATRSNTPSRPTLTLRTNSVTRSGGPSATVTSLNPALLRSSANNNNTNNNNNSNTNNVGSNATTTTNPNSAPGGVKAECSNCGATHTPLWRRGLNDELNCNACGLYCKLHKRPRPKTMRNSHGDSRAQVAPRQQQEPVDTMARSTPVIAQCYNCHTTATPLWRKDDEGKTVCNACGLYYKLHGAARPISMKSDVIRKRSRHDARRNSISSTVGMGLAGPSSLEDASASPTVSRRSSPAPLHHQQQQQQHPSSPIISPDSAQQQMAFDYVGEDGTVVDFRLGANGEILGIGASGSGQDGVVVGPGAIYNNPFQGMVYPGPFSHDYLMQMYQHLPGAEVDPSSGGAEAAASQHHHHHQQDANGPYSSSASSMDSSSSSSDLDLDLDLELVSPRSTKRRKMSTDSLSEPPSSAVSYGSYSTEDGSTAAASSSSSSSSSGSSNGGGQHSRCSSLDSFSYVAYNSNGTLASHSHSLSQGLHQSLPFLGHPPSHHHHGHHAAHHHHGHRHHHSLSGPALRGSGNTLWHAPMMPQGPTDHDGALFQHAAAMPADNGVGSTSPILGPGNANNNNTNTNANASEDSPMDYLHMGGMSHPDDESLFSAYLHHPVSLPDDPVPVKGEVGVGQGGGIEEGENGASMRVEDVMSVGMFDSFFR